MKTTSHRQLLEAAKNTLALIEFYRLDVKYQELGLGRLEDAIRNSEKKWK